MTASVGFAEISTHILIENIIAEIKEQYLANTTPALRSSRSNNSYKSKKTKAV